MKTVLFSFCGREANMRVQMPMLHRILDDYPEAELHLWDLTRTPSDAAYLQELHGTKDGRVTVISHLHPGHPLRCLYPNGRKRQRGYPPCRCIKHKPPYEKPYKWYASNVLYQDVRFVKFDDDVLFLETDRFGDLLSSLDYYTDRVVSANVINNAVCAKYEPDLIAKFIGSCGDPADPINTTLWWALHTDVGFALFSHEWFFSNWRSITQGNWKTPFRVQDEEAISINCVAFTSETMRKLAASFKTQPRLGDEGAVDALRPWIVPTFHVAHLTFGPQEATMSEAELDDLRYRYAIIGKEYLERRAK